MKTERNSWVAKKNLESAKKDILIRKLTVGIATPNFNGGYTIQDCVIKTGTIKMYYSFAKFLSENK